MAGHLIGLPSKNIAITATPSWVTGADSSYPASKGITLEPGDVTKSANATDTYRLTFSSATLVAVLFINTNWGGRTVTAQTNGGMSAVPVTIPNTEHGLVQNGWADFRGLSGVTGTQLNIAISGGTGNPALGTILAYTAIEAPRTRWGYTDNDVFPTIEHRSSLKTRFIYRIPTNVRILKCEGHWPEDRPFYRSLRRETQGSVIPFGFIPDEDDLDARLVQFVNDTTPEEYIYFDGSFADDTQSGLVTTALEMEEVNPGVAL